MEQVLVFSVIFIAIDVALIGIVIVMVRIYEYFEDFVHRHRIPRTAACDLRPDRDPPRLRATPEPAHQHIELRSDEIRVSGRGLGGVE